MNWFKRLFRLGPKEIPEAEMRKKINDYQRREGLSEEELPEMLRDDIDPTKEKE